MMTELATSRLCVVLDEIFFVPQSSSNYPSTNMSFHRSMKFKFTVKLEHNIPNITYTCKLSGCCEFPMFHHQHGHTFFPIEKKASFFRTEKSYLICGNERKYVQSFPDHCSVRMLKRRVESRIARKFLL